MIDAVLVHPLIERQRIEIRITNGTRGLDGRSAGPRIAWITAPEALLLIQQLASSVGRLQSGDSHGDDHAKCPLEQFKKP